MIIHKPEFPAWLHQLSIVSLVLAFACAALIAIDLVRRPPKMWIMAIVWPLTALFGSVVWLAAYWRWGRAPRQDEVDREEGRDAPFPASVFKGASHCGAGCTLGDIMAEWTVVLAPVVATWFGYRWLFQEEIFATWVFDFVLAFLLGVGFQYFTIAPMRDLSLGRGIWQAVKADTASISSWQIGMYGTMAIIQFALFRPIFGGMAKADSPEFWGAMQLAMLAGFCTAYPVNWWLIRTGVKEKM